MIVLDTNVLSVMMRPEASPEVLDWLDTQPVESLWTTAITLFEIRFGLASLPDGRRRRALAANFERLLREGLGNRLLDFDAASAFAAADLMARLRSVGRPIELRDLQIAGIVSARRATLATRNVRHFEDANIALTNPWNHAG